MTEVYIYDYKRLIKLTKETNFIMNIYPYANSTLCSGIIIILATKLMFWLTDKIPLLIKWKKFSL